MSTVLAGVDFPAAGVIAGYVVGPATGLMLLIIGMTLRSRDRNRPRVTQHPRTDRPATTPLPYPAVEPYPGVLSASYRESPNDRTAPRTRLRGTTTAIVGALILGLTAMGELSFHALTDKPPPSMKIGDCLTRQSLSEQVRPRPVDCALPNTLQLAAVATDDRCPDGPAHDSRYLPIALGANLMWCLMPNFEEGQCFRADSPHSAYEVVDCTAEHADIKVIRRADNGASDLCPELSAPLHYPQPQRLYCLEIIRQPRTW